MLRYDDVDIGDPVGPERHEITEELAQDYHESIAASHPRLTDEDSRFVEASILGRFGMRLVTGEYSGEGMIHAKQAFDFESPVEIGDTVIAEGEFSDKYERRGRKYVAADTNFRTESGKELGTSTIIWVVEAIE